jgi:hypothetical protein
MAQAVLDYYACEMALHYSQGMTGGAESRGTPQTFACRAETDYISWLWFGDAPRPVDRTFFKNDTYKPPLQAVHAATSRYRPPREAVFLAKKEFSEPAWHENSKPAYLLDRPGYIRHFQYTDPDFTLGSACYPYGAFASSVYKNVTWKLVSRVPFDSAANPMMVTGGGMFYEDLQGKMRNPWLQVVQHKNILVQLNQMPVDAAAIVKEIRAIFTEWERQWQEDFALRFSPGDDRITSVGNPVHFQSGGRTGDEGNGCYIALPDGAEVLQKDRAAFVNLGKTFLAVRSVAGSAPLIDRGSCIMDRSTLGTMNGLVMEAVPARDFKDFNDFIRACAGSTMLGHDAAKAPYRIRYISLGGDTLDISYSTSGTFTEPVYDWGFGPGEQLVIHTSPPFLQPEWPSGEGHGRIPEWKVNGMTRPDKPLHDVKLEGASLPGKPLPPVYDGPYFRVEDGVLEVHDNKTVYSVDYSGEQPQFFTRPL